MDGLHEKNFPSLLIGKENDFWTRNFLPFTTPAEKCKGLDEEKLQYSQRSNKHPPRLIGNENGFWAKKTCGVYNLFALSPYIPIPVKNRVLDAKILPFTTPAEKTGC